MCAVQACRLNPETKRGKAERKTPLVKADMAEAKQAEYLAITLPGWSDDPRQSNHGPVDDGA